MKFLKSWKMLQQKLHHYYVDKVQYKGKWKFWQHTDVGKLPGIKGYVDFNIYNGSYYELKQLCIGNNNNEKKFME